MMKIIGLTGGSGAGKSIVCKAFKSFGIESIDTDKIARDVAKKDYKNGECLTELVKTFSSDILKEDGELDRKKLADIAFCSKENHADLNRITHKYILNECDNIITNMQNSGIHKAVIIDAPVLFESGFDKNCDIIISVISDLEKRIERIIKRDKITAEKAEVRIKNQKSDKFLIENSNYLIYNNSDNFDYDDIFKQVEKIYNNIFRED